MAGPSGFQSFSGETPRTAADMQEEFAATEAIGFQPAAPELSQGGLADLTEPGRLNHPL